jgi:hypothetical protein
MTAPHDFLAALWGADAGSLPHVGFVAELNGGGWKHHPVKTVAEAVRDAERISSSGHDTYFACASFKTAATRKGDNAVGAFSFWVDIDCGAAKAAKGDGYPTQADALRALKMFCEKAGLPLPPVVVSSGYGLHVYWSVGVFVPADRWRKLAKKLKALAARHGFRADPSRTADIASVLRVPATLNYKNPADPNPVQILRKGAPIDFITFAAALEAAAPTEEDEDVLGSNNAREAPPPETSEEIETARSMLKAIPPDIEYPQWRRVVWAVLSTGWTCAERLARDWSQSGRKWKNGGAEAFAKLAHDFKQDGGISFRTLVFIAREHGWSPVRPAPDSEANAAEGDAATPRTLKAAAEEFNRHHFRWRRVRFL